MAANKFVDGAVHRCADDVFVCVPGRTVPNVHMTRMKCNIDERQDGKKYAQTAYVEYLTFPFHPNTRVQRGRASTKPHFLCGRDTLLTQRQAAQRL